MRSVPVLVAVALGAMVLAAGCGQQHAGTPASPSPSGPSPASLSSPAPSGPAAASCASAAPPIRLITITYADNGRRRVRGGLRGSGHGHLHSGGEGYGR